MPAGRALLTPAMAWVLAAPLFSQIQEGYAELPGVRIFYADSGGTGPAVVFLHAATGSVPMWEKQVAAFTSAGYASSRTTGADGAGRL